MRVAVALALLLSASPAAAQLKITSKASLAPNIERTVTVGDVVLRVERTRPLPNLFGKADIFGRKTPAGFSELRYFGFDANGQARFRRRDVETISSETTMSRHNDFVGRSAGSNNHNSAVIVVERGKDQNTQVLDPETIEFAIDPAAQEIITLDGFTIRILKATSGSLTFRRE